MSRTTERTRRIRAFLLDNVSNHPRDIVALTCAHFGLSRQAINRHIKGLVEEGLVNASGNTRQRKYDLSVIKSYSVSAEVHDLEEHVLWRSEVDPHLNKLSAGAQDIWYYGFTEMVNNVVDHSESDVVQILIQLTAISTQMWVIDNGVGIFRKIKSEIGLEDERHAVLELAKGKLTTDPDNHTGEGIFFSSRAFDYFLIISGEVMFSHQFEEEEDWIMERPESGTGTSVFMSLRNDTKRTTADVFRKYGTKKDDYGFTRTVVPVRLLRHGVEKLVSRSQAKRLLSRFDRFKVVILDFSGVEVIGQAFADEIFRVFVTHNPNVKIVPVKMRVKVKNMITRARQSTASPS